MNANIILKKSTEPPNSEGWWFSIDPYNRTDVIRVYKNHNRRLNVEYKNEWNVLVTDFMDGYVKHHPNYKWVGVIPLELREVP